MMILESAVVYKCQKLEQGFLNSDYILEKDQFKPKIAMAFIPMTRPTTTVTTSEGTINAKPYIGRIGAKYALIQMLYF